MSEDKDDSLPNNIVNEVDDFLKRRMVGRGPIQKQEVSVEEARNRAAKINDIEEDILTTAKAFSIGNYYDDPDATEGPVNIVVHNYSSVDKLNLSVTGFTDELGGMGDIMPISKGRAINFRASDELKKELTEDFGVKTDRYFGVSLFTDAKTFEEIKKLREEGKIWDELMYTYYYFDEEGNSAKRILLPVNFPDDRPVLNSDEYYKSIIEPLSAGDFDLAERTITLLKDGITQSYRKSIGL